MKLVYDFGDRRVAVDVVQHQGLADGAAVERRLDLPVARVVAAHEADDDEALRRARPRPRGCCTHSGTVGASGFSHMTGLPASMQARTNSAWVSPIEVTSTASTSSARDELVRRRRRPWLRRRSAATSLGSVAVARRSRRSRWTPTMTVRELASVVRRRCTPVPMMPTRMVMVDAPSCAVGRLARPLRRASGAEAAGREVLAACAARSGAAASGSHGYMSCSTMQYSSRSRAASAAMQRRHVGLAERAARPSRRVGRPARSRAAPRAPAARIAGSTCLRWTYRDARRGSRG